MKEVMEIMIILGKRDRERDKQGGQLREHGEEKASKGGRKVNE